MPDVFTYKKFINVVKIIELKKSTNKRIWEGDDMASEYLPEYGTVYRDISRGYIPPLPDTGRSPFLSSLLQQK